MATKSRSRAKYEGYVSDVQAICMTCGKSWSSKNAHGVGVRHADAHGHNVMVSKHTEFYYIGDQASSPFRKDDEE